MLPIRKLLSSNNNHYVYFIYRNKYNSKHNFTITLLPTINYTNIKGVNCDSIITFNTNRHIIEFTWLVFEITIDFCYKLKK